MINIYSKDNLTDLKKKKKFYLILSLSILIFFYAISITLCFFLNDQWFKLLTAFIIISSSVGGCTFLYFLFKYIIPINKKINFIESIKEEELVETKGKITNISKSTTIAPYISTIEVTLDIDGQEYIIFFPKERISEIKVDDIIHSFNFNYFVIKYDIERK